MLPSGWKYIIEKSGNPNPCCIINGKYQIAKYFVNKGWEYDLRENGELKYTGTFKECISLTGAG